MTIDQTPAANDRAEGAGSDSQMGVFRLRGHRLSEANAGTGPGTATQRGRRVAWTEDTIDNEGLGKKKSKSMYAVLLACLLTFAVCCIYHKQRAFDESSSESSSDSDASDSDSGASSSSADDGAARMSRGSKAGHGPNCTHRPRKPQRNAYERP